MRIGRAPISIVSACLILGAFALGQGQGQVDDQVSSSPASTAVVPRLIRITGAVHNAAGTPPNTSVGITFTLYRDQNSPDAVWQEIQNLKLDSAGRYSVLLGATNEAGLPLEIFSAGEARWLGVRPEGQAEQPRILLLSVAYALKAADTEMLGGKPASAYVLANSQYSPATEAGAANSQRSPQVLNWNPNAVPLIQPSSIQPSSTQPNSIQPNTACSSVTSGGTATANQIAKFTTACNIENSAIFESGGNVGIGNTNPAGMLDVTGTAFFRNALNVLGGILMPPVKTATAAQGSASNPVDIEASTYNSSAAQAENYLFRWQAAPVGNNTSNTGAALNLLYGLPGLVNPTGLSVASNGILTFASGQTFPGAGGNGTVTSVATGAGLTGGPITTSGTISIPSAGVTNAMIANPSVKVVAGSGLSGGGTVALGGTITLTNAAPGSGGTVTSVGSGTGLTGGPITGSGTLNLDTSFTDARYLQLSGGALTGALTGTAATFTGKLTASTGAFSGAVTEAGAVLPQTGAATAAKGFNSNPLDLQASAFSSTTSKAVGQDFQWMSEPKGNNSATPSGSLNLLFGSNGAVPAETGFSIANTGLLTFAPGQTFPGAGSGTVTSVATGAGLTGGPITGSGTISIPTAGVTNAMIANSSVKVLAGSGLSGGGTVALGGTITLTNAAPSSGGTVTSVGSGTGLTGGPITGSGTLNLDTSFTDARYLLLSGGALTGGLSGTTAAFTTGTFTGAITAAGAVMPITGAATASKGFNSNPFDLQTSSFSSGTSKAVTQDFRWIAEPSGNNSANPSGTLNLLFGSNGTAPSETGLSIASSGLISFASGQTFPGAGGGGTVTSVTTGAGLTGGPITASGTISIPSAGVINAMLANPSITVQAGSGLSGGGTVALGGTVTLTNTVGGTVTTVNTGSGLTGGPITNTGTISIPAGGVTNTLLANPSITVLAGSGLSGGGTVALGGTVTITNSAPSSGGTVTSVGSGIGLIGGPITGSGTLSLNTTYTDGRYLQLSGGALTGGLTGTTAAFTSGLGATTGTFSGTVSAAGALLPQTGAATASKGFNSNPFDLQTSSFSSSASKSITQDFRWIAEPTGNNSANPSGSLNLLFGSNGSAPAETGLSIANNGLINFASGQAFPGSGGSGTVTSVNTGAGLTGGPITASGTISIPSAGVTNGMLANPSITVQAGSGLSGGGTVALGGTVTLTNTVGGTVTTVNTGSGLTGGPITNTGTISIPAGGVTNTLLANPSITVQAGSGLSGGGTVALGGTVTITNSAPSSGGTVTSVGSGTGLTGGPITGSGTLSLNTTYTDGRYLQLSGGALTGALTGTTAAFTSGLAASTGAFSSAVIEAGAVLPQTGAATVAKGFNSNPLDLQASSFSSTTSKAVGQDFQWIAEPAANNSSNPSGSLNLLFGSNGSSPTETGFSIASNGLLTFASGQTFPGSGGSGTVTSVNTGAGLTGGPITASGTISIPSAGVTNAMLANPSITVQAGSGLSGGGTVSLGGTVTLSSTASGGTVTSVGSGTGLTGGPITGSGTLNLDTSFTDARYLQLSGGVLSGALTGTTAAFTGGLASSTGTFSGALSAAGALLPQTGAATAATGFKSSALDVQASSFNSTTSTAATQDFQWLAEPTGNNSSNPSGSLNLLFGSNGSSPAETGLSIASNGQITFASGQSFPGGSGGGTVTSVNTGAGLTGGPITASGTIGIPPAGVTNSMIANPSITIQAGSGLSGGGTVALGGTVTLTNTASGGTVTTVNTGDGLTGGPISTTGTISIPPAGVLNSMLANPFVTILAGSGLSGGGTVALGGTVTLASNLAGTSNGIAYFSSPTGLTSTPAPSDGQVLIGSSGNAPVLGTLTAGSNITITNSPGSVTISSTGGGSAPTLPFFATAGSRNGGTQTLVQNVNKLFGFLLPYNVTTSALTYTITTADNTANNYDIGIFNSAGTLVLNLGPTPGTAFAASKAFHTLQWVQGSTALAAGKYYLGVTTNCKATCAVIGASGSFVSFAIYASAGASTGGALSPTITPPPDTWASGNQPAVIIQ